MTAETVTHTTQPTDRDTIETRLLGGEAPKAIAEDLGLDHYGYQHDDDDVVVLDTWHADDGNAAIECGATSGCEAAQEYVDGGSWGDDGETSWVTVYVWRVALRLDDGEIREERVDEDRHKIAIETTEPECVESEHDWRSPYSVLGGLRENPGVRGHGGGVFITQVCRHCGRYLITDTWAQDMTDGVQGLTSTRYEDADDDSQQWVAREDAEVIGEAVSDWGEIRVSAGGYLILTVSASDDDDESGREREDEDTLTQVRAALPSGWSADYTGAGNTGADGLSTWDICIERMRGPISTN